MRFLKRAAAIFVVLVVAAGIAYLFRSDPIGPISGKTLSGVEALYTDTSPICRGDKTVALETRPENPHSVTTLCLKYDENYMVLALRGAGKSWTGYVVADPEVRIKTGNAIYRAEATRVVDISLSKVAKAIKDKYPGYTDRMTDAALADAWYFEINFL